MLASGDIYLLTLGDGDNSRVSQGTVSVVRCRVDCLILVEVRLNVASFELAMCVQRVYCGNTTNTFPII